MTTTMHRPDVSEGVERLGRVAIATQGVLYVIMGFLAVQVSRGDSDAKASQRGALESVARQPFGRTLLVIVIAGLVAHALWRVALAVRGEPGHDDDGKSMAKRAGNAGRALIYVSLTAAAVRILTQSGSSGGGDTQERSTAMVLDWPAGKYLVIAAGLAVIGAGVWNARRTFTGSFLKHLDLSPLDHRARSTVEWLGRAGYLARGLAFGLVGWFLVKAGLEHDADESRSLDEALRELVERGYGPPLLFVLAIGLVLFGAYRIVDARFRREHDVTFA